MLNNLPDNDWKVLLERIKAGRCTPFLGAGACYGTLPMGSQIAERWADQYVYPSSDRTDLTKVAQYLAVLYDREYPKGELLKLFEGVARPDFKRRDEPHGILARLPLPVYMTTNYDDFMVEALKKRDRMPRRELCRWNDLVRDEPSVFETEPGYQPNVANPVVFHLHGHTRPESLVLTEDDYLQFLATMVRDPNLLPKPIQRALAVSSFLFIGYRLADWNFRVLFQMFRPQRGLNSVAVLVPPSGASEELRQKEKDYLDHYYASLDLRVYWGTAQEFCKDLWQRWQQVYGSD